MAETSKFKRTPRAAELQSAPDEDRIDHIKKPVFIVYAKVQEHLNAFELLLHHPRTNRPPNYLLVGPSNSGKTELLKRFASKHPPEERLGEDAMYVPVIYVQSPPSPDDDMLLTNLLKTLRIVPRFSAKPGDKIGQLGDALRKVRTKVMLIDELNSLLAGSSTRQALVLNTLKYLSNELGISIIASGTKNAMVAISSDPELESRFPVLPLPAWKSAGEEQLRKLFVSFEATLPLRERSHLASTELATAIFNSSNATTGDIATLIRLSAIEAIQTKSERITPDIVAAVAARRRPDPDELSRI